MLDFLKCQPKYASYYQVNQESSLYGFYNVNDPFPFWPTLAKESSRVCKNFFSQKAILKFNKNIQK